MYYAIEYNVAKCAFRTFHCFDIISIVYIYIFFYIPLKFLLVNYYHYGYYADIKIYDNFLH